LLAGGDLGLEVLARGPACEEGGQETCDQGGRNPETHDVDLDPVEGGKACLTDVARDDPCRVLSLLSPTSFRSSASSVDRVLEGRRPSYPFSIPRSLAPAGLPSRRA